MGASTPPLDEGKIDPMGSHPAAKLYRALNDTVRGESQPFYSVALGQDDPEEEEDSWRALEPPTVSESKTPMIHEVRQLPPGATRHLLEIPTSVRQNSSGQC